MSALKKGRSLRPDKYKCLVLNKYKCLVLNSDYSPLSTYPPSIISAQDAVSALWRDRIDVVETWQDAFFRSPSITLAVPKVVALRHYANVHSAPRFCRRNILLRDRFCCQYCGRRFEAHELSYDHVWPRSLGGKTTWANIVCACHGCNAKKRNTMPNHSGRKRMIGRDGSMRPLKQPRQPTTAELLRAGLEFLPRDVVEMFSDYLYWSVKLEP